jgi:hypothetical protein
MQNQTGPQPTNITTYFMKYRRLCNSYDIQLNSVSELERSLLIDCTPLAMNVSQLRMNVSHLVYKAVRLDLRDKRRCLRSETVSVSGAHVQARTGSVLLRTYWRKLLRRRQPLLSQQPRAITPSSYFERTVTREDISLEAL